jgi:hypothetical protein
MTTSRRVILAGHIGHMDDKRYAYQVLVRMAEGNYPLGRPREIGWGVVDWIHMA